MELENKIDRISQKDFFKIKNFLQKKESMSFTLVGDSMEPLMKSETLIVVEYIDAPASLNLFDIVVFFDCTKKQLICHYFLKHNIINDHINTCSINPPAGRDIPFPPRFLLGRVKNFKINFLLKVKIFLKNLFLFAR